jgi:hypothetical protein
VNERREDRREVSLIRNRALVQSKTKTRWCGRHLVKRGRQKTEDKQDCTKASEDDVYIIESRLSQVIE